ncbi:MAG: S41 family peptidase [Planctomycetota bacterium]
MVNKMNRNGWHSSRRAAAGRVAGLAGIAGIMVGLACGAGGQADDTGSFASDAELLIGAYSTIHPGYDRFADAASLDAAADGLRRAAQGEPTLGEMYLAVQRYLAAIRCEHTETEVPGEIRERLAASMLPVQFEYVPDAGGEMRAIVVAVADRVESVVVGDEIVSIEGRPVGEIFEAFSPYISVDGSTDHTKVSLFGGRDDVGLTTFDILHPLLFGERESYRLRVASEDGAVRDVSVATIDELASLAMRGVPARQNLSDDGAVRWEMLDDTTAGLWVNTFVNYRTPIDAEALFASVFEEINASGAERLVYDFRGVGGGSGDAQRALLRHLIDGPVESGGPTRVRAKRMGEYRPYMSTWDESVFEIPEIMFAADGDGMFVVNPLIGGKRETVRPAPDAWRGELVILIGPKNESGATTLLAELAWQREVTLIGEPTGGSAEGPTAGIIATMRLPRSGIEARLPLLRSKTSAPVDNATMGVSPDVLAPVTAESLRAGRDPAMEAALR